MKRILLALMGLFLVHTAQAGYALATPPAGFQQTAQGMTYRAAANEVWTAAKTVRTTAALNVGGRAVVMPAAMRMAANAPTVLARGLFLNPAWALGAVAAPYLWDWLSSKKIERVDNIWMKRTEDDGYLYGCMYGPATYSTPKQACDAWVDSTPGTHGPSTYYVMTDGCSPNEPKCTYPVRSGSPNGPIIDYQVMTYTKVLSTEVGYKHLTQGEFEAELGTGVMPWQVPNEINIVPWPVELPKLNPTPDPNPVPQPLRVPMAEPSPVPNTDPQQYTQPYTRVVPTPTTASPWQVDLQPENVTSTDPNGTKNPTTVTEDSPQGEKGEDDFCTKNPGAAACEEVNVSDVPLDAVPKLYEPKYPDGLVGVWQEKKDQLSGTSLMTAAAKLFPNNIGGKVYPVMMINLDIGLADFGQFDVSPPTWVWDFCGLVVVISALLLARRLVFGG